MASGVELPFHLILLHEPEVNRFAPHIRRLFLQNNFTLACHDQTMDLHKNQLVASSHLVVVCLSQSYISSSVYAEDLNLIEHLRKRVIVLRFDSTLPEPRLKARTRRQVNFQRVTDPASQEFTDTVEKIMNCAHTLLSENPESPEVPLSEDAQYPASEVAAGGAAIVLPGDTTEQSMTLISTRKYPVANEPVDAVVADSETNDSRGAEEPRSRGATMGKPLKDLPGLVSLSRILDTNPDRIVLLATCYDFASTDMDFIRGGMHPGSELPARSFFRFLESSNPDATVGELRHCLVLRRNTSAKALAAVNLYADEHLLSDISWMDMKNLCSSGFEWKYVAECFGHGAHIETFEVPRSRLLGGSRFDVLCNMISAQFPEHTVGDFLENLRKLGFGDVFEMVVKNIEEYEGRRTENGDFFDLR